MDHMRQWKRFDHPVRLALAVVVLLALGAVIGLGALKAAHKINLFTRKSVAQASAGYDLNAPTSAAVLGADLFVANQGGNSVSVVNASTGAHVSTISGSTDQFDQPSTITAIGQDLFVANEAGDSVTEIDGRTDSIVRTISGPQFQFSHPIGLAGAQGRLFVLSSSGPVTAVSTTTGGLLGVASGGDFGFSSPLGIATAGNNVFVTDSATNAVTVIDGQTMSFVRMLQGASFKFRTPTGAVVDGKDLWVTNEAGDSVTEVSTVSQRAVRVVVDHANLPTPGPITVGDGYVFTVSPPGVSPMVTQVEPGSGAVPWMMCNTNGPYLFSDPQAVVVSGSNLWVVNKASSSLTEMDTDSGALIRTIS
jgi:YVTN family beta-propeller protein